MDCNVLNRYYDNNVTMTRLYTHRAVSVVFPIVYEILKEINNIDPRFKIQPHHCGSYVNHLKVSRADEFDFSVVLDIHRLSWIIPSKPYIDATMIKLRCDVNHQQYQLALPHQLPSDHSRQPDQFAPGPGQYLVVSPRTVNNWNQMTKQGTHEMWLNSGLGELTSGDCIVPYKVKRYFKSLVADVLQHSRYRGIVSTSTTSDSPATTLIIHRASEIGYEINVDLCPLIETSLPFEPEFGWPRRTTEEWLSIEKIGYIKAIGCNKIAKDMFYWTLSFAACEKELLQDIDCSGTCRKKVLRIIKRLRDQVLVPDVKTELTSYILMNAFFHECEKYPYDVEWQQEMLAIRVNCLISSLLSFMLCGVLPQYFNHQVNLLASKDSNALNCIAGRVIYFLNDPLRFIQPYVL